MENDVLKKKDPFPKYVNVACRILGGWKANVAIMGIGSQRPTIM